ncbi:MAG: heavy metal translocating P-type ATPase [candidate division Zixibacteria bacterium]|nr:heavy metal translocating P-type ATPase [candidate division Zixibacteria bacterium]
MPATKEVHLKIQGMHCASCVGNIERGVAQLQGVDQCRVNLALNSAAVTFDQQGVTQEAIVKKIKELGYHAEIGSADILAINRTESAAARTAFIHALMLSVPLVLVAMFPMFIGTHLFGPLADGVIQAIAAAIVLFYPGRSIMFDAARQTAHWHANMNTLIALGTLTAFGWSLYVLTASLTTGAAEPLYFDSAGMIITLILLGRYLEARSKGEAGQAIKALMELRPQTTTVIIENTEISIDAGAVRPDMILLVKAGEKIPADGVIVEGEGFVDESLLTGESLPVDKKPGHTVVGGSLNGNRPFKMKVTASGEESFLARIIRQVAEAQSRKAPVQRLADQVASVFVPIVILLAAITLAGWYLLDPANPLLVRSVISVLIIACPCALGLATPTAILVGGGRAAREGIIIRGGDILENLTRVDTVIFDKTGTLTTGEFEVIEVRTFGRMSERNLVRIVGSAEIQSEHPLAQAIVNHMQRHRIEKTMIRKVESRPGFGVTADCDGRRLVVGNRSLMQTEQISLGPSSHIGDQEMEKGRTVIFAALDGEVVGLISMSDRLRKDAKEVVGQLKTSMARLDMISGDTQRTAGGVARSVGLENFQAEVRPEQKKFIVDSYRKAGYNVAMVGDGINDAPALAAANVGIAIGTGTDIAIETADVVLIRPDLVNVLKLFDISRRTMRIIRQNLFWAFFYNLAAVPIAAGVFYPWFGLTLSPVIAAGAMAFSSVFVVSNSLRLHQRIP